MKGMSADKPDPFSSPTGPYLSRFGLAALEMTTYAQGDFRKRSLVELMGGEE